MLEAESSGMLCIVSDAEGLGENVLNEETGWVLPKRDFQAIADKIVWISKAGDEQLSRIRQKAVTRVKEEFDVKKQIREFISFYAS